VPSHISEVRRDFRTDATITLHFLHSRIQFGLRLAKIINVGQADVCWICANLPLEKVRGGGVFSLCLSSETSGNRLLD